MPLVEINLWHENGILSIMTQGEIILQQIKLPISWKSLDLQSWKLKSSLWIYNDAHILEKSDITVTTARQTQVAFKKCGPFPKCIRKIDETTVYDAEDLDLVMAMYNLIE